MQYFTLLFSFFLQDGAPSQMKDGPSIWAAGMGGRYDNLGETGFDVSGRSKGEECDMWLNQLSEKVQTEGTHCQSPYCVFWHDKL